MVDEKDQSAGAMNRRNFLKGSAAAGTGVVGLKVSTGPAIACSTYDGCEKTSLTTSYDSLSGFTTYLGSALHRWDVAAKDPPSGEDYWHHSFRMAGDASCEENGSKASEVTSQSMLIENTDTSYLSVFTSKNQRELGFGPEGTGDLGDGSDVVSAATAVLGAAATAAGSTAASYALSATTLAEILVRTLDGYSESNNNYDHVATYAGTGGVAQCGHHLNFYVDEYDDGDPYATNNLNIYSEVGLARNGWDVAFGDRGVSMTSGSVSTSGDGSTDSTTPDYEWTTPQEMSQEQVDHFGIKKTRAENIPNHVLREMDVDSKFYYVAENPPITTTPITN
ncbi:twin-arginine translocation signal domain-containing protein [Halorussus pelagicus]|uniref:twin-arginine translocation signal domain-containing protein n=1 Tax=Halorussus pelagicus TaxID=2505977 RepID=UPI000FFC3AA9|nr:twin-arginine translocation signal domain-containing protein [Halorussus pelagicus]